MLPHAVVDLTIGEVLENMRTLDPIERNYQQLLDMGFPEEIGGRAAELVNPGALAGQFASGELRRGSSSCVGCFTVHSADC